MLRSCRGLFRKTASQTEAGVQRTMRHLGWCFFCFLATYLALLNSVFWSNVDEFSMSLSTISEPWVPLCLNRSISSFAKPWDLLLSTKFRLSLFCSISTDGKVLSSAFASSSSSPEDGFPATPEALPFPSDETLVGYPGIISSPSGRGVNPVGPSSRTVPYGRPTRFLVGYDRLLIFTGGDFPFQLFRACANICRPSAKTKIIKSPSRTSLEGSLKRGSPRISLGCKIPSFESSFAFAAVAGFASFCVFSLIVSDSLSWDARHGLQLAAL
mmetsp:Transcript_21862/g.40808  ORF Transcript_21862/g.40808 Transcript_21862/m.40808 type:complete len:270 (+) Transcript_21862:1135-1944(+)